MKRFDLGRYVSRKFLVWVMATVLLIAGKLSESVWLAMSMFYIGIEGALDLLAGGRRK